MQVKHIGVQNFSGFNYPLIQKKEEKALFSNFNTDNIMLSNQNKEKKKKSTIKPILFGVAFLGFALAFLKKHNVKNIHKISESINDEVNIDAKYRENIASAIGLKKDEIGRLSSIMGPSEFFKFVKKMSKTPEVYSPGKPVYRNGFSVERFLNENIENASFGANLHIHSNNSDGKMSVAEILFQAVEYANKRAKKTGQPFVLSLTDHDSIQGCKEAVEIIAQQPERYKNLRVVLGCENTFLYKNPELLDNDIKIHVLSYAINPFDKKFDAFLLNRIEQHNFNMRTILLRANQRYLSSDAKTPLFSLEDMKKMTPSITTSLRDTTYYMKDYLQFKIIFSNILSNKRLLQLLKCVDINPNSIDFSKAMELIPKNPDYSKGQKYYEYYREALKTYILELLKEKGVNPASFDTRKIFTQMNNETIAILQDVENRTLDPNAELYVKPVEYLSMKDGLSQFSEINEGVLSLAHPTVFFPVNGLKNYFDMPKLYEDLYSIFAKFGKNKALMAEDFYQVYYQNTNMNILQSVRDISARYGLIPTGGLDTHGNDIFSV